MNLETSAGSGDYKLVTQSTWPLWGYALNNDLSKCENGSTIIWDDENNAVKINGRLTDKCYFYFALQNQQILYRMFLHLGFVYNEIHHAQDSKYYGVARNGFDRSRGANG